MNKIKLLFCLALLPFLSNAQTTVCDTIHMDSIIMTFNQALFADSINTIVGNKYYIKVSGTFTDAGVGENRDAAYWTTDFINWTASSTWKWNGATPQRPDNDVYDSTHNYTYTFTATDSALLLSFYDVSFGDNSGTLIFDIFEIGCSQICDSFVTIYDTVTVYDSVPGCDTNMIDSLIMTFDQEFSDSFMTEIGKSYTIEVSGIFAGSYNETRDAAYGNGFFNNYTWTAGTSWKWNDTTPSRPDIDVLDTVSHTYYYTFTANDSFQVLSFSDNGGYSDNSGELRFSLWETCGPPICDSLVLVYDTMWINDTIDVFDTIMVYDTILCDTSMVDTMEMTFGQEFTDSFMTEIGNSYTIEVSGIFAGSYNETRDAAYGNGFFNGYTWTAGTSWKWNDTTPSRPDIDVLDTVSHTYYYTFTANDSFQVLSFSDNGGYGDNSGALFFTLWDNCSKIPPCDSLVLVYDTMWTNDTIDVFDTIMVYDTIQCDTILVDSMEMTFNQAFEDSFMTEIGKTYHLIVHGTFAGASNEVRDAAYGNGSYNGYAWGAGTTWKWNDSTPQRPAPDVLDTIDHEYIYSFTAVDSYQVFTFSDGNYNDNSGSLHFELWETNCGYDLCDSIILVYDTMWINDTTMVYDTMTVNDTVTTTIYDTTFVTVTDTLLIDIPTGLAAPLDQNMIKVYPNPGKTIINIEHSNYLSMAGYSISIVNSVAINVYNSQITSPLMSISVSAWPPGTYFLQIYDSGTNLIEIRHIVLQ